MPTFATLTDVKANLDKVSSVDDNELQGMLDAATEIVRYYVGDFAVTPVTERVVAQGGTVLLSQRPVVGNVTLTLIPYGGTVTGHTVDAATGVVYCVDACGPITATYSAGSTQVPAAVQLATALITAHLWETQRGTSPSALALQGASAADLPLVPGAGSAIPNRAKELLEPYLRRSQVA